jgi:hypothetical protein
MSSLRFDGDDHPEAAGKHLADAGALVAAARPDGAAYLVGYVAECALKSLILLEKGIPAPGAPAPWKKGKDGHDLSKLQGQMATLAIASGAKTASYFGTTVKGLMSLPLAAWDPEMRYRAPMMAIADAKSWVADADSIYAETVGAMMKDGVL